MTIEELVDTILSIGIPGEMRDVLDCILDEYCCCSGSDCDCERGCAFCWRNFLVENLKKNLKGEEVHLQLSEDNRTRKVFKVR